MDGNEKLTLSITETAAVLGVSRPTIYRLIQTDGFPLLKLGRISRIPKKALEEWIEARTGKEGAV